MENRKRPLSMEQSSHKVIEKRRRDRINNCLAELSQAIPPAFSKQTSGKLEKAEILEMTVDYLRAIQTTEIGVRYENGEWFSADIWTDFVDHHQMGYNECMREIVRFLSSVDGLSINDDRYKRMVTYLQSRFRPESSIRNGTVYRNTLQRVASKSSPSSSQEQSAFKSVQRPCSAPAVSLGLVSDFKFPVSTPVYGRDRLCLAQIPLIQNVFSPSYTLSDMKYERRSMPIEK